MSAARCPDTARDPLQADLRHGAIEHARNHDAFDDDERNATPNNSRLRAVNARSARRASRARTTAMRTRAPVPPDWLRDNQQDGQAERDERQQVDELWTVLQRTCDSHHLIKKRGHHGQQRDRKRTGQKFRHAEETQLGNRCFQQAQWPPANSRSFSASASKSGQRARPACSSARRPTGKNRFDNNVKNRNNFIPAAHSTSARDGRNIPRSSLRESSSARDGLRDCPPANGRSRPAPR